MIVAQYNSLFKIVKKSRLNLLLCCLNIIANACYTTSGGIFDQEVTTGEHDFVAEAISYNGPAFLKQELAHLGRFYLVDASGVSYPNQIKVESGSLGTTTHWLPLVFMTIGIIPDVSTSGFFYRVTVIQNGAKHTLQDYYVERSMWVGLIFIPGGLIPYFSEQNVTERIETRVAEHIIADMQKQGLLQPWQPPSQRQQKTQKVLLFTGRVFNKSGSSITIFHPTKSAMVPVGANLIVERGTSGRQIATARVSSVNYTNVRAQINGEADIVQKGDTVRLYYQKK
ncbi:MAG: hypothetical protein KDK39_17045 [Leptospiraceae bacterium]|nr:hypothetical protein [Leptospiraceae bacterium]